MENLQNLPAADWQWQTWQKLPYLTSNLLKNWQHGFFTASFYPQSPTQLVEVFDSTIPAYRVKQVHGNRVLTPAEIEAEQGDNTEEIYPLADALISDHFQDKRQSLWVASADCTPLLIGDQVTGQAAAVHAGWRGTAQRIVPRTIQRFLDSGSQLEDLRIAMGPAIAGKVYQVTEEVAEEVLYSLVENPKNWTNREILVKFSTLKDSPLLPDEERGKIRLDVPRVNQLQLIQMGIQEEQIAIAPYCTYQSPNLFFSYRRTQQKTVQWSGIVNSFFSSYS